jgi:hypothetical protein
MNILLAGIVGGTVSLFVTNVKGGNTNLQSYTVLFSKIVKLENQLNKIHGYNNKDLSQIVKKIDDIYRYAEISALKTIQLKLARNVDISKSDIKIVNTLKQNKWDVDASFNKIEDYVFTYGSSIKTEIFQDMSKLLINKYYSIIADSLYKIRNSIAYKTRTIDPDLVNRNTFLDTLSFANINVDIVSLKHNTDVLMAMTMNRSNFPGNFNIPVARYCRMRIDDTNQLTRDDILHLCILIAKSKDGSKYFLEADKIRRHFMHVDTNLSHNQIVQLFANFKYCTQMGRIEPYCNERYRNI